MKRTLWVFTLAALMFSVGAVALALRSPRWALGGSGSAVADTSATKGEAPATEKAEEKKESPAEEKKETPAQEKAEEKSEGKTHHVAHKAGATMPMVDINSATKEELMKIHGLTDAIADKIVAGRPFASRSELLSKKILTPAEYAKIRARVMAKKPKATAK